MPETSYEFTDRYAATGTPYPNPATMCEGDCEGMGCYPHHVPLTGIESQWIETPKERIAWEVEHATAHTAAHLIRNLFRHPEWWCWKSVLRDLLTGSYAKCDGYHFIKCSDCNGTGKKAVC